MGNVSLFERIAIEPKDIIGTKWDGFGKMFCNRLKVEFVDHINCIYTSKPDEYTIPYTVTGGKIFISEIEEPFERKGDILFNGGLPVFKKAA